MLVDGPVHVPPHAGNPDVGIIDKPAIADTVARWSSRLDDQRSEALHPPIDRNVINLDATLSQELFNVSVRQPVAEVPPDCQQDYVRWEPVAGKRDRSGTTTTNHPGTLGLAPDPSTQQCPLEFGVTLDRRRKPAGP